MNHMTIDSEAFRLLCSKIDMIAEHVVKEKQDNPRDKDDDIWIDSSEACNYLKISQRTLYRLRVKGIISYSVLSGKIYFTVGAIKKALQEHTVRGSEDKLKALIEHPAKLRKAKK